MIKGCANKSFAIKAVLIKGFVDKSFDVFDKNNVGFEKKNIGLGRYYVTFFIFAD